MMKKYLRLWSLLLVLVIIISSNVDCQPAPTENFKFKATLQGTDEYILYWKFDSQKITFEAHVKNADWLLFGIHDDAAIPIFSDAIIASIYADDTGYFSQVMITSDLTIHEQPSQLKWRLLDAFKVNNTYTVIKFDRNIKVRCDDSTTNLDINMGVNNLVFAIGNNFNSSETKINRMTTAYLELLENADDLNFGCSVPAITPTTSIPTAFYSNKAQLMPGGLFEIYWNVSSDGKSLIAEIQARTVGWVAFGISPDGGFNGSNLVLGYIVSDGSTTFAEGYIKDTSLLRTTNQSVTLIRSGYLNNYSYFTFSRPLTICDAEHLSIEYGPVNVVFAFGTNQVEIGSQIDLFATQNRGSKQLNILSSMSDKGAPVSNSEYIDFDIKNAILPKLDTVYYCQTFKIPNSLSKRHIYKYEILMPEINREKIKRVVMYECPINLNLEFNSNDHSCFVDLFQKKCTTAAISWAVGGELVGYFPSNTGYPIGGDSDYDAIMMEIHFDNPLIEIGFIDQITMRYHMTSDLRPNELGVLAIGTVPSGFGIAIPPGLEKFNLYTQCDTTCITKKLLNTNISIVASLPSTQSIGVSVSTSIIRDGDHVDYLFENSNFQPNYQQMYYFENPISLSQSDQLVTKCGYNTKDKRNFTLGGLSWDSEACLNYLLYYPRVTGFSSCLSYPYENDYIDLLNNMNSAGEISLNHKIGYNDAELAYALETAFVQFYYGYKPITRAVKNKFIKFFNTSRLGVECGTDSSDIYRGPINRVEPKGDTSLPSNYKSCASRR